jgi:monovalent cation/proton antiporter MnhG/PhaG subunit
MSFRHIVTEIFLWLGVALNLFAAVGILVMRNAFDRLHFPAVATLGALMIAIAVVVEKSFSLVGDESLLIAAFLVLVSPVLTHATARAIRIDAHGDWRVQESEDIETEEKGS